ncbi:hypothetical protein ANN_09338 [Periplaneta americana]|uniref:Uncharacterized protein n=1 Tax=Periplaneta americana TaxID=6978 RepID=A0ABQ8TP04_PERAM|nr:hypothetical protein ANN_09338 [Periplaneta americana]
MTGLCEGGNESAFSLKAIYGLAEHVRKSIPAAINFAYKSRVENQHFGSVQRSAQGWDLALSGLRQDGPSVAISFTNVTRHICRIETITTLIKRTEYPSSSRPIGPMFPPKNEACVDTCVALAEDVTCKGYVVMKL